MQISPVPRLVRGGFRVLALTEKYSRMILCELGKWNGLFLRHRRLHGSYPETAFGGTLGLCLVQCWKVSYSHYGNGAPFSSAASESRSSFV